MGGERPAAAAAWLSSLNADDPAIARASSSIIREWTRYDLVFMIGSTACPQAPSSIELL